MADLATIGFRSETKDLDKASKKLNTLAKDGDKTQKKVDSLESKFKSFGKNASASVASIDGPLGGISSRISSLTTVATAGGLAMTTLAVGVTGFSIAVSKGIKELDDLQVALAKSDALIRATGSAAGKTGEGLAEQAQEVAAATLASVAGIQKAQSIMLTFRSVSGSVFDDSIMLAQDMATVIGGDASTAALQLGKALNAPIQGLNSLSRAGIQFTQQQKDQIKTMIESGEVIKAQNVILDELKGQIGGVAEAVSEKTLSGSIDLIGQSFDNLTVQIATNLDALDSFKSLVDKINSGIQNATEQLKPDTATESFEKTFELQWEANAIADELEGMADGRRKRRLEADLSEINKRLSESQLATKLIAEGEQKISTARGDALLESLRLRKLNAKLDREQSAADEADKAAKAYGKWKATVEGFLTPAQKLKAEINKINEDLLSGKLTETSGLSAYLSVLIEKQNKLNETAQDTSFQDFISSISSESTSGQIASLTNEIEILKESIEFGFIDAGAGNEAISKIEDKITGLSKTVKDADIFGGVTDSIGTALQAMQGFTDTGSKEYAKLGVAISATNAIQAIGAVINQGQGDPYSAFGRMAAMAASMAALGQSIGSLGGSNADSSAANQAAQGTTIWGDKAESIANSIDITANASEELVGINTGMLKALQSMQAGISAAAGISARGMAGSEFGFNPDVTENVLANVKPLAGFGGIVDARTGNLFSAVFDGIGKMLGGSSKVTDSGIQILGGAMTDVIDGAAVFAFQETKSKKTVFSSTKTNVELQAMEEASAQFGLVFKSLSDTVKEAGSAIGMNSAEIEKSIKEFNVATTKISLEGDLSIEEKEAEIQAVFGKIFNNLSAAVVPFITAVDGSGQSLIKTGEEISEALVRVASQVQIADFGVKNLGIDLGDKLANPEMYARIADNLATMVGGIEDFGSKMSSFVDDFAPETLKFDMASTALTDALTKVGLDVPTDALGFFDLMQGANAEQAAALLNIQGVAGDYFDLLEGRNDKLLSEQNAAQSEFDNFNKSLLSLSDNLRGAIVGIYGTEVATSKLSLTAALESARLGDFSKALDLNLSNLSPSMEGFESLEAFNIEQAITANKLAELADLSAGTSTVQDMTLTANQEQVTLLTSINDNINTAYVPQQQQVQNNDTMTAEIKMLRADIAAIRAASEGTERNTLSSSDDLDTIVNNGIETRSA